METFDWTKFTRRIAIKATMKAIYDAWTIPAEIEKWFLSDAAFFNADDERIDSDSPITAGNRYEWQWYLWDGTETGIVTELNGTDKIQFTFAGDCLVEVNLKAHEDHTLVWITQTNIPTDDASKQNIRLGCDSGWSFYLVNLKSIYEGGLDLRNKSKELGMMLNN